MRSKRGWRRALAATCLSLSLAPAGCGESFLSGEELMDPRICQSCHPVHYRQWSGSMHAYAGDDPVFLAMNRRGQEETGGELGDFCVACHAPMAVRTGATVDGLNLPELPAKLRGVTCYFCHTVTAVRGDHNNPLVLADDHWMRGGVRDPAPVANNAHGMRYSPLHDRERAESSQLCGACHDIVTPAGIHLERTFLEWKESIFSRPDPGAHLSCGKCHMKGDVAGVIADFPDVPLRKPRDHGFPGVDVALTPWPEKEEQLRGIERDLFAAISPRLCVQPGSGGVTIDYVLDNVFAGHMLPSGAAQDRRMWAEVRAFRGGALALHSGAVAAGEAVAAVADRDPTLWQMRDFARKESGEIAHMFWEVRAIESRLLPPSVTNDPSDPRYYHAVARRYPLYGAPPQCVDAVVHVRPMGLDVLDDLIASGHLDPAIRAAVPTFTLSGTALRWTVEGGYGCVTRGSAGGSFRCP